MEESIYSPKLRRLADLLLDLASSMNSRKILIGIGAAFVLSNLVTTTSSTLLFPTLDDKEMPDAYGGAAVPLNPRTLDKTAINAVLERNIFNSSGELGDIEEVSKKPAAVEGEILKSDLPLNLLGTIFAGDPRNGIALIEEKSSRTTSTFMAGEKIAKHSAEVIEILQGKVILQRGGVREYIEVEVPELKRGRRGGQPKTNPGGSSSAVTIAPVATAPPPDSFSEEGFERKDKKITMTGAYKRKLLTDDFTKVLQDAKATPYMVDGQLRGFKLTKIRQDSIYNKAGFQNGDVITEINGVVLTSASQAIATLQSLRDQNEIEVRGEREGAPVEFFLNIKE
jgi:general secretion pathway protein C